MPTSRVIPKRLPVAPGQDSRFSIRRNSAQDKAWWVYYKPQGGNHIPADQSHPELVARVNRLKEIEGNQPGGAFSINEHSQVIARMSAPAGYPGNAVHVVDISDGVVFSYGTRITFAAGALDPTAEPAEGAAWPGPLCGTSYSLANVDAPKPPSNNRDEIWIKMNGADLQLSAFARSSTYPPATGPLARFLASARRQIPRGGRFRVNEHGRAFTSRGNIYIGTAPIRTHWFGPIGVS